MTEAEVSREVRRLYATFGFAVYSTEQGYRPDPGGTRCTEGIADLRVFHVKRQIMIEHELKTPEGLKEHLRLAALPQPHAKWKATGTVMRAWRRAHAQGAYGAACRACNIPYVIGGYLEAVAMLEQLGFTVHATRSLAQAAKGALLTL